MTNNTQPVNPDDKTIIENSDDKTLIQTSVPEAPPVAVSSSQTPEAQAAQMNALQVAPAVVPQAAAPLAVPQIAPAAPAHAPEAHAPRLAAPPAGTPPPAGVLPAYPYPQAQAVPQTPRAPYPYAPQVPQTPHAPYPYAPQMLPYAQPGQAVWPYAQPGVHPAAHPQPGQPQAPLYLPQAYGQSGVQPVAQPGQAQATYPQPGARFPYAQPGQPAYPQPGQPAAHASGQLVGPQQPTSPTPEQSLIPALPRRRSGPRTFAILALTVVLLAVFGVGGFSGWVYGHGNFALAPTATPGSITPTTGTANSLNTDTAREAAIAKILPSMVMIVGQVSGGEALGSGIIVDSKGDIITNHHVVEGASNIQVQLPNGKVVPATLVGSATGNDLSIIRVTPYSGMVVATLGDSSKLTVGQEVLAVGSPLGYTNSVSSGVVSALNREARESSSVTLTGMIQTSAPINPGNSGGALINLQGEVVGIPTLSAVNDETNTPANGIGFAIPSSQVSAALTQIVG